MRSLRLVPAEASGVEEALAPVPGIETDVRLFSKPVTRPNRRMGVALALARNGTAEQAREAAKAAAARISIRYGDDTE